MTTMFITDIRDCTCGLDKPTDKISIYDVKISQEQISGAHLIVVVNGQEIIVLKDRYEGSSNKIYPVSMLPIFVLTNLIEDSDALVFNVIKNLSKYLNSKEATELSKQFEKIAFERS